ncbi:MAG: c-type cytochrome [Planctomycetota bacterium]|nr:c-type cytochrome [Planctomycetota bacterium]
MPAFMDSQSSQGSLLFRTTILHRACSVLLIGICLIVVGSMRQVTKAQTAAAKQRPAVRQPAKSQPRRPVQTAGARELRDALSLQPRQETKAAAARGYQFLTTKAYLPADFDQQTFDELWKTWEEPLRSQAEKATPEERRKMAFSRYGLTVRPGDKLNRPLQYVVDAQGNWSMNCLACHSGKVAGRSVPGVPNSHYALQTLTEEVRQTKLRLGKPLTHMDLGSMFMPLGTSNGTTNAVMFGVALLGYRDADLNIVKGRPRGKMTHHDHDAPAWWHYHRKKSIYIDGFASKGHRALMQFILVKENGPEHFRQWEQDFADIESYLESLRPPKYPWPIDAALAKQGEQVFAANCASCHGTYGPNGKYPEKRVPIDRVGTDRVRLDALSAEHRAHYGKSWFAHLGQQKTELEPDGYVAPPLDGIWASAPYFHNGSVPTLWHVLHSDQRPVVWQRSEDGYDQQRVGLEVTAYEALPSGELSNAEKRRFFDTRQPGKSASGHTFPDKLSEQERGALLEYLKTL